jgi:hypothetical protein
MCGSGACLSARVAATLLLNQLNQTHQPYNGRTIRKRPAGFTEPGSRADGFGVRMTYIHKQSIVFLIEFLTEESQLRRCQFLS